MTDEDQPSMAEHKKLAHVRGYTLICLGEQRKFNVLT